MLEFTREDLSAAEMDRLRRIYEPLTKSVRALIDATIRTEMDEATVSEVTAQIDAATTQLRTRQLDGPYGVRYTYEGTGMAWGNPVIGVRNPIAPPVDLQFGDPGKVWADFHLGAAYEGPPGHVHGGVCALVLDHVLGEVASGGLTRPAFTGTISCRYLRATRLGDLHTEATIERIDGVKTFAVGHLADEEGITVEAEGVFIIPKWAR
jgi:acyl-coenzyme A thioesterase PaaI-like protein